LDGANSLTVWEIYDKRMSEAEKKRIAEIERLDEIEEWKMMGEHYCISWGWNTPHFINFNKNIYIYFIWGEKMWWRRTWRYYQSDFRFLQMAKQVIRSRIYFLQLAAHAFVSKFLVDYGSFQVHYLLKEFR
jgi:hypothetical protein